MLDIGARLCSTIYSWSFFSVYYIYNPMDLGWEHSRTLAKWEITKYTKESNNPLKKTSTIVLIYMSTLTIHQRKKEAQKKAFYMNIESTYKIVPIPYSIVLQKKSSKFHTMANLATSTIFFFIFIFPSSIRMCIQVEWFSW